MLPNIPHDQTNDVEWMQAVYDGLRLTKTASTSREDQFELSHQDFGVVFMHEKRAYPRYRMDTPEHVQISSAYLLSGRTGLTKEAQANIATRLCGRYDLFGIRVPEELSKLAVGGADVLYQDASVCTTPTVAVPLSASDHAVVIDGKPMFPMRTTKEAQAGVDYFEQNWQDVPVHLRRVIAEGITKKASVFHVLPGEVAQSYLGEERSWLFKSAMIARSIAAPKYKDLYMRLSDERLSTEDTAYTLAELDKLAGVNRVWDDMVPDPWRTTYDNTIKLGEERYEFVLGNHTITGADLVHLSKADGANIEKSLGVTLAQDFIKNPVAFFRQSPETTKKILGTMVIRGRYEGV